MQPCCTIQCLSSATTKSTNATTFFCGRPCETDWYVMNEEVCEKVGGGDVAGQYATAGQLRSRADVP